MKKKIVYICLATLPFLMVAFAPERSSAGAPASHTGAPGEQTCATVGCHDDNVVNTGTASLNIEVGSGVTQYVAGQTYPIKIKISDANVNRFGFQLVALDDKSNKNVGTFEIVDHERTQFMLNEHSATLKNRNYVTYTFAGTDATTRRLLQWCCGCLVHWVHSSRGIYRHNPRRTIYCSNRISDTGTQTAFSGKEFCTSTYVNL